MRHFRTLAIFLAVSVAPFGFDLDSPAHAKNLKSESDSRDVGFDSANFASDLSSHSAHDYDSSGAHGDGCCDSHGSSCGGSGCGGCCSSCYECDRLFGFFAPSAPCFDDFISPMTNPLFFEDPRTLTEARLIFIYHDVPRGVLAGGDVQLLALQVRAALTERLSIIATKDGFLFGQPNVHPDGWADVALGLKYNLLADPCSQLLWSMGFTYELPVGSQRALQASDDGDFHLFTSWGAQLGTNGHWVSGTGFRLAVDEDRGSDLWYWSNHFDYGIGMLYPFMEVNWFHWTRSGTGGVPGVEGADIYNLGSTGVAGNDIVTMAAGLKIKPSRNLEIGTAYEVPVTRRRDITSDRFTCDLILRY